MKIASIHQFVKIELLKNRADGPRRNAPLKDVPADIVAVSTDDPG